MIRKMKPRERNNQGCRENNQVKKTRHKATGTITIMIKNMIIIFFSPNCLTVPLKE